MHVPFHYDDQTWYLVCNEPLHVLHVGQSLTVHGAQLLWQRKVNNPSEMAVFNTLPSVCVETVTQGTNAVE